MAMWTSDYDCGHESDFWYVVKDSPFNISQLKSKRRYEITRGNKYFTVREFDPAEFGEQIYSILVETLKTYKGIKASADREEILRSVKSWHSSYYKVYGAFFRENGELAGYTLLRKNDNCISIPVHKTKPQYEKYQASAALLNKMLQDHSDFLASGGYICDGSRNIQHKTNFHDYLAKYFQFRRAYCQLHIIYHPRIKWLVKLLYPFRKILRRFDGITIIHNINGVLLMEEISRSS